MNEEREEKREERGAQPGFGAGYRQKGDRCCGCYTALLHAPLYASPSERLHLGCRGDKNSGVLLYAQKDGMVNIPEQGSAPTTGCNKVLSHDMTGTTSRAFYAQHVEADGMVSFTAAGESEPPAVRVPAERGGALRFGLLRLKIPPAGGAEGARREPARPPLAMLP